MAGEHVSTRAPATGQAAADRLAAAHARLLHDPSFQFAFSAVPKPPKTPEWLLAFGRWLKDVSPVLQTLFWVLLALGVAAVAFFLIREFVLYRQPGRRAAGLNLRDGIDAWRPSAARARALLADADRLAAQGRWDEAARVLLHRSIDDIDEKRPHLIAPAFTSRDIAGLAALPAVARDAFALIARHVERSLFGGRALDAADFAACRRAYEGFALDAPKAVA